MEEMTTHKRVELMYEHRQADRAPVIDEPWRTTIERWRTEGMGKDIDYIDYFGLDRFRVIPADNSPRYPREIIEETDEFVRKRTAWGAVEKSWKNRTGVPHFSEFMVTDPDSWEKAKARMTPSRDRIDWDALKKNFKSWRDSGSWISGLFWFGFDVTHSYFVPTDTILMSMITQPEWVKDMFDHFLNVEIALFDMIWDAGYHFDEVFWYDDMGYKGTQFFSPDMYREILKPSHKRAVQWANEKGIRTRMHSCGKIDAFIPDLIDIGVEMLNPIEVKSGLDPVALKKQYGDKLGFHGGLNAVLYGQPEKLWDEMRRVIPEMKKNGGYIISSDHSVPDTVSLETFRQFVKLAKELGSYE